MVLLLLANGRVLAQPKSGYSYVNVTKQTTGGPVEPGDILEIRFSVHIPWGYNTTAKPLLKENGSGLVYNVRYVDMLPTNTAIVAGSTLNIITNEGVVVKSYTQNPNDNDAGAYKSSATKDPDEFNIKINLGRNPGKTDRNTIESSVGSSFINVKNRTPDGHAPKWFTGHLFATAFRVRVTGNYGDVVTMGQAQFKWSADGVNEKNSGVSTYTVMIARPTAFCTNTIGTNFAEEYGGTFGSGNTQVRSTNLAIPITGYRFIVNSELNDNPPAQPVDDGMYSIVKNLSPNNSTNPTSGVKMFGTWDIIGDHTGTNNNVGNPAPAKNTTAGYMLVVNSDYVTNEAYRQNISGLCPNTTYEFSAWVRNVCKGCHWDSLLATPSGWGVRPNLTWVIDGIDQYSTGEINYNSKWIKKGFVFTTGGSQNNAMFSIRNNAQGGGGNDWVMDDITIATCQPDLTMRPYGNTVICYGNPSSFDAEVKSVFNNYTYWRWEISTNGGATWAPETDPGSSGIGTPTLVSGQYTYIVPHPTFIGDETTHGNMIRLRIGTTSDNLNDPNCSFLATTTVVVMVNNCTWVLNADITQFKAQQTNNGVALRWEAVNEKPGLSYVIEKSHDQQHWTKLSETSSIGSGNSNTYTSLDPNVVDQVTYYRINMVYEGNSKYAKQLTLQPDQNRLNALAIRNVLNPFRDQIPVEFSVPANGDMQVTLYDLYGKAVKIVNWKVTKGVNKMILGETSVLPAGTYILMMRFNDQVAQRKLIKMNQ